MDDGHRDPSDDAPPERVPDASEHPASRPSGFWETVLGFFLENKLVVLVLVGLLTLGGLAMAPFRWDLGSLPRNPVPVDAIPDIGENQQIIFTEWPGRSPRDVEDQITYPLTTAITGISGVRTVRSYSMFGLSSIYVIFDENTEFYWSRSRVLEKLASLPTGLLPDGVAPALGPDATALGQVFWYTLEGRDADGNPTSGWDLSELRSLQDFNVRYALSAVPGVSEVASVGGFVREYQVDVNPEAALAHRVGVDQIANAVRSANLDVGARTVELNGAEYVVRGRGFIDDTTDIEEAVVDHRDHTPIRVRDVAKVGVGPAQRRGVLDVAGAEAVGGVVVVRYGDNPLEVIERIKKRIEEIAPGLPKRTLDDGTVSQVTVVPFYDRTGLIEETLETLSSALLLQVLITVIVVLVMLRRVRTSLVISSVMPFGILLAFVLMKAFRIDANIMALSGIAIAIGTMVDVGIVFVENITQHLDAAPEGEPTLPVVRRAAGEVAPAVLTSTLTTLIGFLPIFALTATEGKLFTPLAYTKTFAIGGSFIVAAVCIPALAHLLLWRLRGGLRERWRRVLPERHSELVRTVAVGALAVFVAVVLADTWLPLGAAAGPWPSRAFVAVTLVLVLGGFWLLRVLYPVILAWCLGNKAVVVALAMASVVFGVTAWRGFDAVFGWLPASARLSSPVVRAAHALPGFGREFMPPFDEGSYLYMPTTMPHASIGTSREMLKQMDAAIQSIPEVDTVVGKLGRVDSALDPAPVSMFETVVSYHPEFAQDERGRRLTFRYDAGRGTFARDADGELVPDEGGRPYRLWRDHIHSPSDIWDEIQRVAQRPGVTSAPELMPIAARIVMLQSGMRAPMGLKIHGPDLETIERVGLEIEGLLKRVPGIRPETVVADRIVGKPYIEIEIDRAQIARYGISISDVQDVIQVAIGGRQLTRTVEGRERYAVRVRYMREQRDSVESIRRVMMPTALGHQIPLEELAHIEYVRGPQVIKSEDTFLTGYVVFDKVPDRSEVDVVEQAQRFLKDQVASGRLDLPAGTSYAFSGSYENQLRSEKSLSVLFPTALALIFLIIYLQFRRVSTTLIVFSGVALTLSGGFLMIWLYGQPGFLSASPFGVDLREVFQVRTVNVSVAVWVGFIALVGIATDDGVLMSTYLSQRFRLERAKTVADVRRFTVEAALRRVRPCLMTTATTIIALLPIITSRGKGSDVMLPMALPAFGGMILELGTLFVVPVLYALVEEGRIHLRSGRFWPR